MVLLDELEILATPVLQATQVPLVKQVTLGPQVLRVVLVILALQAIQE